MKNKTFFIIFLVISLLITLIVFEASAATLKSLLSTKSQQSDAKATQQQELQKESSANKVQSSSLAKVSQQQKISLPQPSSSQAKAVAQQELQKEPSANKAQSPSSLVGSASSKNIASSASASTKSAKLTVVNENAVQFNSDAPQSICVNPTQNTITIQSEDSPPQQADPIEYEYITGKAVCTPSRQVTELDFGIEVPECNIGTMVAGCSDSYARIVNYGGDCGSNYPIRALKPESYLLGPQWHLIPPITSVRLSCFSTTGGSVTAHKTIYLTCMRQIVPIYRPPVTR